MIARLPNLVPIIFVATGNLAWAENSIGLRDARNSGERAQVQTQARVQRGFQELSMAPIQPSASIPSTGSLGVIANTAAPARPAIQYIVFDQTLDTVLTEVGKLGGYSIVMSRDVTGKVAPGRLEGTADQILDRLKSGNGLVTMREGTKLIVATEAESTTRMMRMGGESADRIRETVSSLAVDDLARRITIDEKSGLIQISAPPVILERIESILANAARTAAPPASGLTVVRYGRRSVE